MDHYTTQQVIYNWSIGALKMFSLFFFPRKCKSKWKSKIQRIEEQHVRMKKQRISHKSVCDALLNCTCIYICKYVLQKVHWGAKNMDDAFSNPYCH